MNPYTSYKKNQVENAAREDIMLQLIQGALMRVKGSMNMWDQGEETRARELRLQALDIISYLDETLDWENGGEIAEQLDALYSFMIREIGAVAREQDCERLQPIAEILEDIYNAFKEAVVEYKQDQKAQPHLEDSYVSQNSQQSRIGALG